MRRSWRPGGAGGSEDGRHPPASGPQVWASRCGRAGAAAEPWRAAPPCREVRELQRRAAAAGAFKPSPGARGEAPGAKAVSGVRRPCFSLGSRLGLWGLFQAGRGAEKETGPDSARAPLALDGFLLLRDVAETDLDGRSAAAPGIFPGFPGGRFKSTVFLGFCV